MATLNQHVRDIMTSNPSTVSEKDTIRDVAQIMAREDTGVVPVCDGKKIIGLITDRDIVVRLVADGRDLGKATVNDVMSRSVRAVREDTPVQEVIDLMSSAEIRRVPVVDDKNELVGIVSMGDIASKTSERGKVGHAIEDISKGAPNN